MPVFERTHGDARATVRIRTPNPYAPSTTKGTLHAGGDPKVAALQSHLNELGYRVKVDGQYGPETDRALRQAQHDMPRHVVNVVKTQAAEPRAPRVDPPETLGHAILRMRNDQKSDAQIAAQIRKWHPHLTPLQVSHILQTAPKQLPGERLGAMFEGLPRDYGQGHVFEPNPYHPESGHAAAPPVKKEVTLQTLYGGLLAYDPVGAAKMIGHGVKEFVRHPSLGAAATTGLGAAAIIPPINPGSPIEGAAARDAAGVAGREAAHAADEATIHAVVKAHHAAESGVHPDEFFAHDNPLLHEIASAHDRPLHINDVPQVDEAGNAYRARTLTLNEKTQQLDKPRSRISQAGTSLLDAASREISKHPGIANVKGVRLLTVPERVAKAAGRAQRQEGVRATAAFNRHAHELSKVKAGSAEDIAHYWYAQLPKAHRNANGLSLILRKQEQHLEYIASGRALADANAREQAIRAAMREATDEKDRLALLKELEQVNTYREDLPHAQNDVAASIAQLREIVAHAPAAKESVIRAMRAFAEDRQKTLVGAGRLNAETAEARKGAVARWVGLVPDGSEVYAGHRLATPEGFGNYAPPSGGVGRVRSPKGVGTENRMILAQGGRVRATTHIAHEDWHAAQVFRQANVARDDLAAMGTSYKGGAIPADSVLINPKGKTIPTNWKSEDLAQFGEDIAADPDALRKQAEEIVNSFLADGRANQEAMKELALMEGQPLSDLRVVPKRLVERYYSQFKHTVKKNAYDSVVDGVSTSIIFARLGYIPKNTVQNLIMALPHQGAMLPVNAVRSAQVLKDSELRDLVLGEVGGTGATGALRREGVSKVFRGVTDKVTMVADAPFRVSAFLHEAAAEGVISKVKPILDEGDRQRLMRLLTNPSERARLNDIRARSVEAMADFSRLTPDQARQARRFLIIPGWLMAGTRYPFHFAATHPIRTALLAYIALGEPGGDHVGLHFNEPVTNYIHGSSYRQGIDTPWGRLRTSSLDPVSTPEQLAQEAWDTAKGKKGPFDYTPTIFDEVNPLLGAGIDAAQGEGIKKSLLRLAPDYTFARGEISPKESKTYPEDTSRLGRLKRELGVVPIQVNDPAEKQSNLDKMKRDLERLGTLSPVNRGPMKKSIRAYYGFKDADSQARHEHPDGGRPYELAKLLGTLDALRKWGQVSQKEYDDAVRYYTKGDGKNLSESDLAADAKDYRKDINADMRDYHDATTSAQETIASIVKEYDGMNLGVAAAQISDSTGLSKTTVRNILFHHYRDGSTVSVR